MNKGKHVCAYDIEKTEKVPLHNYKGSIVAFDMITHQVCSGCKTKHPIKRERTVI